MYSPKCYSKEDSKKVRAARVYRCNILLLHPKDSPVVVDLKERKTAKRLSKSKLSDHTNDP